MLILSWLIVLAGFAVFYFLPSLSLHISFYIRIAVLLTSIGLGLIAFLFSTAGRRFIGFSKDAQREIRKVIWPTRKEAGQTTLVVFGFVLVMAVYLWISDRAIEWLVFSLILRWK